MASKNTKKILFLPPTIGMHEIYFRDVKESLDDQGIPSEVFQPTTIERYEVDEGWNLEKYFYGLSAHLADNGGKYILVPHSNAGTPAIAAALAYKNVNALVLLDCVPDWEYQNLGLKTVTAALGALPDVLKDVVGGSDLVINGMLSGMLERKRRKERYGEILKITKDHGGKNLVRALNYVKEYTSGYPSSSDLLELAEEGTEIYSIEASKSSDTKKYFDNLDIPQIRRIPIDSRHLVTVQEPELIAAILHGIYRVVFRGAGVKGQVTQAPQILR